MTAIEKLKLAFETQVSRNVDLQEEFIFVSSQGSFMADGIAEALSATEPADYGEEPNEPEPLTVFDVLEAIREIEELEKREPLPFKQEITDPGQVYMAVLAEWQSDKQNLAYYKEQEAIKRRVLFDGAFPAPNEGTNRLTLFDGRTVVGTHKIGRKLDEAALPAILQLMRDKGIPNVDALVNYKPSLAIKEWRGLTEDAKLEFSPAVISKPGMPDVKIEEPKKSARG